MISRVHALGLVSLLALVAGCGVDVEEVCEDLGESCAEVRPSDCQGDGEALEQASDDFGCSDLFDAYLDCIDEASCGYATACDRERVELEACVDFAPPD